MLYSTTRNIRSYIRINCPMISIGTKIPSESVLDFVLTWICMVRKKSGLNYTNHFRREKNKITLKTFVTSKAPAGGGTIDTHPSTPRNRQVKARNMTKNDDIIMTKNDDIKMTENDDINSRCPSLPNPQRKKAVRCDNEVQQYQFWRGVLSWPGLAWPRSRSNLQRARGSERAHQPVQPAIAVWCLSRNEEMNQKYGGGAGRVFCVPAQSGANNR